MSSRTTWERFKVKAQLETWRIKCTVKKNIIINILHHFIIPYLFISFIVVLKVAMQHGGIL